MASGTTQQPSSDADVVRPVGPAQASRARLVIGRAFHDYPLLTYAMPQSARRLRGSLCLYGAILADALRLGEVVTNADVTGVACWLPPGTQPMTFLRQLRGGMAAVPWHFGLRGMQRLMDYDRLALELHHRHAPQPHWYLAALGVDPQWQGRGIGSRLIEPQLARADREGLACYLDTHLPRNVTLYERHGFRVMWTGTPAGHPVPVWSMRRDPRG